MFLWWGPELIQFYNDGYRPSIREDKHPGALGYSAVPNAGRRYGTSSVFILKG